MSSTVTWASDCQYSYLSSFREWVAGGCFFPLPDVKAAVEIQESTSFPELNFQECSACRQSLHSSQLLDKITSVNWRCIDLFDLRTLVCVFFVVYTCRCNAILYL